MYRGPERGHGNMSSSGRPNDYSSSGSRSSRPGASASSLGRGGRSPRRSPSRSPSPRGRRHRSPPSSRSSRRSPSPWRRSRRRSPGRRSRSRSPRRHSCSPERRSSSRHSESSVEQYLRITVGNDHYGIETPERKRLSDRLGSPVDSLSDVDRDDLADGPIFRKQLSHHRRLERYPSHEENPSSPYHMRHNDYHSRDVFIHEPGYGERYDHLQEQSRETDRDVEPLRKSLYSSEDGGRELKRPRYARDDRLSDMNTDTQGFTTGTRNYRKRSPSRSPSRRYLNEEFRELESARRKRKEEELRDLNQELPDNGYMMPSSAKTMQSSEHRYLYRPDEASAMPKKSILKKRVDDTSAQPEVFSSGSVEEPPLLSDPPPPPPPSLKRSTPGPFALEVQNFLKRFNKNAVEELASHKESKYAVQDQRSYPGQNQSSVPFEQNSGSFLTQKEHNELKPEPVSWQNDFLLPHERASQDGSGFSHILGMMADSTQEKKRRSFQADIEDEEKFLYGDYEDDSDIRSLSAPKVLPNTGKEPTSQKAISSPPDQSVKADLPEEPRPAYEKIHDLLKTIGLDIGVAEIGKLAARTQERLHGKKTSLSPDGHLVSSHKSESQERQYSRSNTLSPESSRKRSPSPPNSFPPSKDTPSLSKSDHNKNQTLRQDHSSSTPEGSVPLISVIPSAPSSLSNVPPPASIPQYNISHFPPFTATQLPPNYPPPTIPPPGYDAYRHYMAYAASGWPMYAPQPDPALSDLHRHASLAAPPNPTRPNLRVIETVSTTKGPPAVKQDQSVHMHVPSASLYSKTLPQYTPTSFEAIKERISDERNRASQKQKVIEERENLKIEQEARQKKLHYLKTELNRLSKQQGEMLRKKRREKDGHKDPLLVEVNCMQENIVKEIAQLKMSFDATEKKQSELDKVAQILGINIFEKSRKPSSENKDSSERNWPENAKTQERTSSSVKESKATSDKPKAKSPKPKDSSSQTSKQLHQGASIYNYYDAGNHWCKDCNTICGTMFDFFTHMHNKKHRQTLDPYNRPWAKTENEVKQEVVKHGDKIPIPAKGSEFLIPVTGYYCQLCHEFFGDQISAEQHVKSHPHNEKYKKHIDENPLYEERRNLDRQAGLSVIQETERRLKRKQCEKQKEEKDEKPVKVVKTEEPKTTKELKDEGNDRDTSKNNEDPNRQESGTEIRLTKDDKEVEKKDGRKEEPLKDSRLLSFGKFSWRKTEKDEKSQGKEAASPKEESAEECKDKENKSQTGKTNSKSIAIKLSGKTVIPHTNPWMPVLSTSAQSKIRPNLPVPTVVLRKFATATVSKPAPLNTFLSIKSSGATTKPLPVVKEGGPGTVLSPDIVSKVFGGEDVVLNENANLPEQELDSVTKAIEHAKALEHVKQVAEAKEQARSKAKEQEMMWMAKRYQRFPMYDSSYQCHPLLLLAQRSPLVMAQALPPPPPPPFPPPQTPPKQTILADDRAPGVSEDDKNILAMPMCPHPLPPPTVFGDHFQKLEKKHTPLAAGNAQDLYDIFYNSSGRNPAGSRIVSSATSDKGKLNPDEKGQKTEQLLDSKPSNSTVSQDALCNAYSSSDVSNISLDYGTLGKEEVGTEKYSTASKENTEFKSITDKESGKIFSTTGCVETSVSNDLPTNAPASFQNKEEIETPSLNKISKETPQLGKAELVIPLSESIVSPLENDGEKASELEETEHLFSDVNNLAVQMSDSVAAPSEDVSKKPLKFETSEFVMPFSECSVPSLEDNEKLSELETAKCKSPGDKESTMQLLEYSFTSLEEVTKEPLNLETARLAVHLLGNSTTPLEELDKNPSTLETVEDKLTLQLSEESAGHLENTRQIQGLNYPDKDLLGQLPEESTDFANESVIMRDVGLTGDEDTNEKLQNQQTTEEVGTLGSILSTNNVESSSNEELIFTKNSTNGSSRSDVKLNDMKGTDLIETKNASYCSVQPQMIEESLDSVPSEINGGNFGDKALTFTDMKPEDLNTSADTDFKLILTNSELNFDQPTSLTLNFNTENESVPVKSDEIHSTDLPRLTSTLEIETVDFRLGDIEGEREQLDLLPSEILHEDTVDCLKLASVIPVCLEPSKTNRLDIAQPIDEPEIIDFVALTSGNQEDTFCSLVYDTIDPPAVSLSNEDTAESDMPLTEMQAVSSVSKVLQADAGKYVTSDTFLNSDGKYVQNQETTTCMESLFPVLKETSIELGGSGDSELCTVNKEMQNSGGEPTKTEGEGNDSTFEINSKLTSDVPESSTQPPLL